ncbi:MFS transporter [Paraconexibacter algicola]|uniref:MFS transporter n=1 Tax=Paraconexibacter algicola TaxID=2133960 RepID=A0A2T4UH38_9ACTN|nr:MFS transporter [Paraconexibacter algicola]PTL58550.1 MFS transporter [Paraconexibacter algicola]
MTPLARRLYAYAFLGDFVLLYPLYALLFEDHGLSTAEISSLLAIWSVTGFVLEVPSGVWADVVSRRRLLTLAPLLSGAAFGLWVAAPSYPVFALGFVLWGAQGALQSGALEALVHDELERQGHADRYAELLGRATACGTVASATAIGLAAPAFALGGFGLVGAGSVLACGLAAAVGATFPEHRTAPAQRDPEAGLAAYGTVLRDGLAELRSSPAVRAALPAIPAVAAVWGSLDEYLPLLAVGTGVGEGTVPLLGLLVYAAMALGGVGAARAAACSGRARALLVLVAAAALAAGALARVPAGFVLVALAFAVFQAVTVAVDARLQEAIEGEARSTVTSVASLATEVVVLAVFGAYALGSLVADDAVLFAVLAATYVPVAWLLARPDRTG